MLFHIEWLRWKTAEKMWIVQVYQEWIVFSYIICVLSACALLGGGQTVKPLWLQPYWFFGKKSLYSFITLFFKGVLYPWPILWLFMHFSQKLQHIGDK